MRVELRHIVQLVRTAQVLAAHGKRKNGQWSGHQRIVFTHVNDWI